MLVRKSKITLVNLKGRLELWKRTAALVVKTGFPYLKLPLSDIWVSCRVLIGVWLVSGRWQELFVYNYNTTIKTTLQAVSIEVILQKNFSDPGDFG